MVRSCVRTRRRRRSRILAKIVVGVKLAASTITHASVDWIWGLWF